MIWVHMVLMPSRAFYDLERMTDAEMAPMFGVLMPSRAFYDLEPCPKYRPRTGGCQVLMPSRAFYDLERRF